MSVHGPFLDTQSAFHGIHYSFTQHSHTDGGKPPVATAALGQTDGNMAAFAPKASSTSTNHGSKLEVSLIQKKNPGKKI